MENNLFFNIGPLKVTLHRTVRVDINDENASLPPSLGTFELYKVKEYRDKCPKTWEDDAIFIPMHKEEAMWISFNNEGTPLAVLIGAGGINAINGEKLTLNLEKDNYIVTPPQPWIDGWKNEEGSVYQFVATEYKDGEGKSVGEQILKNESVTGGLGIAVFESKNPERIKKIKTPREFSSYDSSYTICGSPMDDIGGFESCIGSVHALCEDMPQEMGIGKGGKIDQKIYDDPYGLDEWKEDPSATAAVYLINGPQFTKITGLPMPPLPETFDSYKGIWYGLDDKDYKDVQGTDKFDQLKNVFEE